MNQKIFSQFIMVMGISLTLIACGQAGTKKEEAQPTETTSSAQPDAVQPPAQAEATDAVTVAPNLYKVLSDSLGIRILQTTYQPGDSSAMHSHPDNVLYVVKGGTVAFTTKDGTRPASELITGMTAVRPAESHSAKNTGKTPIQAILVEVSRPMDAASRDAALDAVKVAPNLYKVKSDSAGIRVIEINYKPGQSSAMHAHPDAALYVIEGSTSEFTGKDGRKQTLTLKPGTAMIIPAGVHSVKNVGTTTSKAILVEVYRQRQ
jgi:quercetin dioxygenase-like cupin family protein